MKGESPGKSDDGIQTRDSIRNYIPAYEILRGMSLNFDAIQNCYPAQTIFHLMILLRQEAFKIQDVLARD